jgi:hypothetical protein
MIWEYKTAKHEASVGEIWNEYRVLVEISIICKVSFCRIKSMWENCLSVPQGGKTPQFCYRGTTVDQSLHRGILCMGEEHCLLGCFQGTIIDGFYLGLRIVWL